MYLKRLELQGFKSFADRTIFEFSPGVSAIVGPNGSGKSNVVDAVRWVLGEQSAKTLRGGKMEDVIFSGSHGRKPVGMAKVTLILDNSDGGLPLDYAEVAVARTLYRSGESRYEINRQGVRLRDVQELFMDTGLGKDGFSVIGQGKIDDILSLQADERRGLIEEAAGISKYKYRKREAERRLTSTEGDIDRLEDIFYELDSRLPALAEQAEAVERYQALDQQEKAVHLAQLVSAYDEAQAQHERVGNQLAEAEEAYVATVKAVQEVTAEDTETRHLRMQTADALQALNERHLELVQRHDEAAREAAVASERLRQLEGLLTEDGQRLAQEKAKWGQGEDHLRQLAEKEKGLSEACDALKAELAQLDDALSGHRRLRDRDSQALEALA
ncbi:MAG: chromosome segregation SMC family protein, partial [Peptococcus niger]